MSETPLQALIRKKKEAQALAQASAETQPEVKSEEVKDDRVVQPASNPVDAASSTSPVTLHNSTVEQKEITQAQAPTKPMSAMDRIRAMKSGGSGFDGAGKGVIESTIAKQEAPEIVPELPPKPRKTHPIAMEMAELEAALNSEVPGFVSILSTIHKKLKADPNVVTLLDDEEIGVIVAGLEKHTNVTIVAPAAIKAAKSKAKKEPVSAMDL